MEVALKCPDCRALRGHLFYQRCCRTKYFGNNPWIFPIICYICRWLSTINRMGLQKSGTTDNFAFYYQNKDHLGTVRETVTSTGAMKQRVNYYPFGGQLVDTLKAMVLSPQFPAVQVQRQGVRRHVRPEHLRLWRPPALPRPRKMGPPRSPVREVLRHQSV